MKTKTVVSVVAGGLLGAGVVTVVTSEFRRLRKIVAAQDNLINANKDVINADKDVIAAQKEELAAKELLIERQVALITRQKEQIELLQNELEKAPVPGSEKEPEQEETVLTSPAPLPLPRKTSPPKPKKNNQKYFFQYDTDFKVVGRYASIWEAREAVGLKNDSSIYKAAAGIFTSAAGYFWSKGQHPLKKIPDKWKLAAEKMKNK